MKIVFFGTSQFAVNTLTNLKSNGHSIVAVVTQPDRRAGRSLKVTVSPVRRKAQRLKIPIFQPKDVNEKGFVNTLKDFHADFFVVVAFGEILKKDVIDIPKFGCLNIHASLLPKYRGAAPINWAIINGEEITGVTIMMMNEKLDAGDIVVHKEVKIEKKDTSKRLGSRLADIGAKLLIEAIRLIVKKDTQYIKQDERYATYAPKLTKKDGEIGWSLDTASILNRIRGLKPWPGTYTFLEGRLLKIISAEAAKKSDSDDFSPGEVIAASEKEGFIVKTKDGAISISLLQIEGKKEMTPALFLRGHEVKVGTKLG